MDELMIHDELLKINNIHHSLNETNIMTYVILRETNKSRFNQAQLDWIQERIDALHEKQRQSTEAELANIDVELAKTPICEKTSSFGVLREV